MHQSTVYLVVLFKHMPYTNRALEAFLRPVYCTLAPSLNLVTPYRLGSLGSLSSLAVARLVSPPLLSYIYDVQ